MPDPRESEPGNVQLPGVGADKPSLSEGARSNTTRVQSSEPNHAFDPWRPGDHQATKSDHKNLSTGKKVAVGVAAVVVASLVLAIGFSLANRTSPDENLVLEPNPSSEAASEPEVSQAPEFTLGDIEILEHTATLEQMEAMSIEQFGRLPYVDRAAYAYLKNPSMAVAPVDEAFEPSTVVGYYWQAIQSSAVAAADTSDGAKIVSAIDYYTTDLQTGDLSEAYRVSVDSILATGGAGVGIGEAFIHQSNGQMQQGVDRSGNRIKFINVTYAAFRTTGEGEQIGSERTAQVFQVAIKLSDGRTVMTFPRGYTIEGTRSPVEGYPY